MESYAIRGIPGEGDSVWIQFSHDEDGWHWSVNGTPTDEERDEIDCVLQEQGMMNKASEA